MYDVDRLLNAAAQIELSQPSNREVHDSFHNGYRRNKPRDISDTFAFVLDDFAPVAEAWLSHMEPGADIPLHKDASPWKERWQVPIQPAGRMTVDGEDIEQVAGVPFQVEHWKWHEVVNDTDRPRIHLVIDRDVVAHEGTGKFHGQ
jgi:quercetin dioxygenase-like cupin family protein